MSGMSVVSGYDFEIVLGTYEEYLMGYVFMYDAKEFVQSFAIHAHQSSVRAVAANTEYIASGGADEIIQLFNMTSRAGSGRIMQHGGTITALSFTPDGSHLVSGSVDGSITIYKSGNWQLEKVWQNAHKGSGIHCISIHPTGKLALSVGQNRTLKTWNLLRGRAAYTTNLSPLGKYIDYVSWSKKGTFYAIPTDHQIHVFDVRVAGITCVINCSSRITTVSFLEDEALIFGEQDGWIVCYNVDEDKELWKLKAANKRIKCLGTASPDWLISVTSEGEISLWKVRSVTSKPVMVTSINCGCRVVCMSIRYPPKTKL